MPVRGAGGLERPIGYDGVPVGVAKAEYVRAMFDTIAPDYDLMNRLMTLGLDVRWRWLAARVAAPPPGGCVLDVATGTGDLAFALARQVGPAGTVVGVDFAERMLALAREKAARHPAGGVCRFEVADALSLPYPDGRFDAATIAFGLRNVADLDGTLREMARVVRPGGRVVSLELSKPAVPVFRELYYLYLQRLVPLMGWLVHGSRGPYAYLPRSLRPFPDRVSLARRFEGAGLRAVQVRSLLGGVAAIHVGVKV